MKYFWTFLLLASGYAPVFAQTAQPAPSQTDAQTAPAKPDAAQTPPAAAPAPVQAAPAAPAAAASPAPSTEQWISGSFEVGYRWTPELSGNMDEYRSVVNLGAGPRLLDIDLTIIDPKKRFFDRLDARASGWGDPNNSVHVDATKLGIYDFRFDYRNMAYFNAVPSFANPGAPAGFNEQAFDTHRRMMSADLDLLPGKHFVPYLSFDHNSGYGNGVDTYVDSSNNEYAVPTLLRDSTNNYRGGVRVEYSHFHVSLEQGGTTYKDDDFASDSGLEFGDNTQPLLGQVLDLSSLKQTYGIRGSSLYSRALLTASATPWLNVYAQFLYSEPKTTVNYVDIADGNFALLSSLLFYSGQVNLGTGTANQPHTTASGGFEMRPLKRVRVLGSWMTDRYHDADSPLLSQQIYLTPTTLGPDSITSLNYTQYVNYNQGEVNVIYDAGRRLTLRAGYRRVWGDATELAGQLSQTGLLAAGQLQRNIALAGATYRAFEKLSLNLDYEGASSDHIYFRTSLNDYQKGRARARYQLASSLTLQARFQALDNQNPDPGIRYDFQSRDSSLGIFWTPKAAKRISVSGEYDRTTLRSNITYLTLPTLGSAVSAYRDNAHTATATVDVALPGNAKLSVGGSLFLSSGSQPTNYYQPMGRFSLPIGKHVFWNTEWQWYGFNDSFYGYEGFRTHIVTTGLRVTR
ncbi:MAG: hypothetical protein ACLPX8_27830 [Bryobacteraceae bacterium]|jgi:hypothetical protein